MLYKIMNPSDAYTIMCADLEIATVACCMLGGGQYAFEPYNLAQEERREAGEPLLPGVPLFLFGGVEAFCREHFGEPFEAVVARVKRDRADALAAAFDSVVIGDRNEYLRALAAVAPADYETFRAKWHNDHRSSMNDIGGRAYAMAAKLRAGAAQSVIPAPRQVFIE